MDKQFYFPAPVEVVKVTLQNLQEVAQWCGGRVATSESKKHPGRMDDYVWVPTPKSSKISWAYPGMFITKRITVTTDGDLKETFSVFRRDYFERNFFETPLRSLAETWERQAREQKAHETLSEIQAQHHKSLAPSSSSPVMMQSVEEAPAAVSPVRIAEQMKSLSRNEI